MNNNLASRSVNSVKWNSISNIFQLVLGIIQTIILARLLPIETFGVYAGASAIVVVTSCFANFGMAGAFLYRCKETEDIEKTASVHFTLQAALSIIWALIMLLFGFIFIKSNDDGFLTVFIIITLSQAAFNFAATSRLIFARAVEYKRIAIITIIDTIITFIIACTLALLNKPLWALVTTNIVNAATQIIFLDLWKPVWRPKFGWDAAIAKYLLRFGSQQVLAIALLNALDRFDDLWIKFYIGSVPLGFYSKAYSFAQYPGKLVADPISNVSSATYAEIASNREKLSEAFYRSNSLMIYTGFFVVGAFILIAPEFIRVVLGVRWMPMLLAFQIMLPYAMFEPMKRTMSNVFPAVGKPQVNVKIRFIQLLLMVVSLYIFGNLFGIAGVAVAVDVAVLIGIGLIFMHLKRYVDYSLKRLFAVPLLAIVVSMVVSFGFEKLFFFSSSDILSAIIKLIIFSLIFISIVFLLSKEEIKIMFSILNKYIIKRKNNY